MSPAPDYTAENVRRTRERAAAFLEDMQYFREVLARPEPSRGELRRLSGTLRRLVVDRDITIVANPRIKRFLFDIPDTKEIVKALSGQQYGFFGTGGATVFGRDMRKLLICPVEVEARIKDYNNERMVAVRLDGFCSQPVLFFGGHWISRQTVIKYVAYKASGIHSQEPESEEDKILSHIRRAVVMGRQGAYLEKEVLKPVNMAREAVFKYSPEKIDVVLWELLGAVHLIATSNDTKRLEEYITRELKSG